MALTGAEFKARLDQFVAAQMAAVERLDAEHLVERGRLIEQIKQARAVLANWDARVEGLIDTLQLAGIFLSTTDRG